MESWDPVAFKTLLRTTSQRLGQLQERKDAQSQQMRRDIAKCLWQGQVALARSKAATLIQDDVMVDLLEELEMLVGVVGSRVAELGAGIGLGLHWEEEEGGLDSCLGKLPQLSPALVEAAATIIYAAPSTGSKDLNAVRDILVQRLGPVFVQAISTTRDNHVSSRAKQILSSSPPTAVKMDGYLVEIAHTYDIQWVPEPQREALFDVISEILRVDGGASPIVDLPRLREMCARGLPDNPPWIRPRIWRLFFGTLPVLKSTWAKESQKQRDCYYDLVNRVLAPLGSLPSPTNPLSPTDVLVAHISDSLFHVSSDLFSLLENEPKCIHSGKCPLDPTAPETIHIACASNLDTRLALLKGDDNTGETPEIRLESELNGTSDSTAAPTPLASWRQRRPTTLVPSKAYNAPPAHHAHLSALLRLLYIHSSLNPAVQSPYVPWLLVPLYSALIGETDENDAAHAEADTFWVFEALVGEIAVLEEEEGGKVWTRTLSERIKWADGELAASLHATGLDPVLPHYSYRWLAPLLTQTLPLSSVFPIWDVLFSRPMRTRDVNPKLEHLVDVCTALLVHARTPLFRLGKPARNVPGLWTQDNAVLPPVSPLRPWELSDAFKEGITLLASYPIDAAGGIDRILQTASDLTQKRIEARERAKERERENVGFGARITQRMWKGLTNHVEDVGPEEEEEEQGEVEEAEDSEDDETGEHDDGNETETPAAPTLTSRLAKTVWRGITNQSSMDDEVPSPPSPLSASHSPEPVEASQKERFPTDSGPSTPSSQAGLWGYAEKFKDSDTIAAFSKVSTNWRAKALDAWRVRKGSNASMSSDPVASGHTRSPSIASDTAASSHRQGSLPESPHHDNAILDPPRPPFFRSPRESFLPLPRREHTTAPSSPNADLEHLPPRNSHTASSASSLIHRAGTSLASLTSTTPKSVPRPLMLNSRELMTTKPRPPSSVRSEGGTPEPRIGMGISQWGEVLLATRNRHALRQESISSTSSLSASEAMRRSPLAYSFAGSGRGPRSDYESDESGASRRVRLNRTSVSPMALASRSPQLPWNASPSGSVGGGRCSGHPLSNGSVTAEVVVDAEVERMSERGGGQKQAHAEDGVRPNGTGTRTGTGLDSPTTIGSPPIPRTPLMPAIPGLGVVRIVNGSGGHIETSSISTLEGEGNSIDGAPLEVSAQSRVMRKKGPGTLPAVGGEPVGSESEASALSVDRTPVGKAPVRLRSKRHLVRPANLRLRPTGGSGAEQQQQQRLTPSPRQTNLTRDWMGEYDLATATTPKMEHYVRGREEETEVEDTILDAVASRSPVTRKLSKEMRLRKSSTGSRDMRRTRDSGAEEGDDEGYDELLSAYESEEGSRE